jgi:hypothetical protein
LLVVLFVILGAVLLFSIAISVIPYENYLAEAIIDAGRSNGVQVSISRLRHKWLLGFILEDVRIVPSSGVLQGIAFESAEASVKVSPRALLSGNYDAEFWAPVTVPSLRAAEYLVSGHVRYGDTQAGSGETLEVKEVTVHGSGVNLAVRGNVILAKRLENSALDLTIELSELDARGDEENPIVMAVIIGRAYLTEAGYRLPCAISVSGYPRSPTISVRNME